MAIKKNKRIAEIAKICPLNILCQIIRIMASGQEVISAQALILNLLVEAMRAVF